MFHLFGSKFSHFQLIESHIERAQYPRVSECDNSSDSITYESIDSWTNWACQSFVIRLYSALGA